MLKRFINFLLLCSLLPKLIFNLGLFSYQYVLLKSKTRREIAPLLLLILLIICLFNWRLWQKRQTPLLEIKTAPSQNDGEILYTIEQGGFEKLKNFYLELETKQQNNRDILFNLGKLFELENNSLAQDKFKQSWELDPNYFWGLNSN